MLHFVQPFFIQSHGFFTSTCVVCFTSLFSMRWLFSVQGGMHLFTCLRVCACVNALAVAFCQRLLNHFAVAFSTSRFLSSRFLASFQSLSFLSVSSHPTHNAPFPMLSFFPLSLPPILFVFLPVSQWVRVCGRSSRRMTDRISSFTSTITLWSKKTSTRH